MPLNRFRVLLPLPLALVLVGVPLGAQEVKRTLSGTRPDTTAQKPPVHEPTANELAPRIPVGRGVIDGVVTDSLLRPLFGARVSILRTQLQVATGPNGRFRIAGIPFGQYILIVRRGGYSSASLVMDVPNADTVRLSYVLQEATAAMLAPVVVTEQKLTGRMKDFEDRRKRGEGEFMTQAQIEQHNPAFPTELLRLFSSVSVQETSGGGGQYQYYPVSARATGGMTSTGEATCFMTVFVDNVPMPSPFNLDLLPSPREIAGVEVYAGAATIPFQYGGMDRMCGVILVWTKDGSTDTKRP